MSQFFYQWFTFLKQVIWFSLSIFKENSKFQNQLATQLTTKLLLMLAWSNLALAPRWIFSLVALGIFTWPECEGLGPQDTTQTLPHTVSEKI